MRRDPVDTSQPTALAALLLQRLPKEFLTPENQFERLQFPATGQGAMEPLPLIGQPTLEESGEA
jgi:hypothetical protein